MSEVLSRTFGFMGGHLIAYRWLRSPKALVFTPIVLLLLALVACGSTVPAEPVVVEKEVIKEIIKEVPIEKEIIQEVENRFVVTRAASTAVLATPTKQSALDCQARRNHLEICGTKDRPGHRYILGRRCRRDRGHRR